jgi:hypothetical protein
MHKNTAPTWPSWLFMLTALWGALIFWLAPHPPMIDLPQHAGQVALLRDLLLGQSPWSEYFRINWLTPYLIGYSLALPLSLIMPVAAALKLLLSLAYFAFVCLCIKLRWHFGADSRLNWLFLLSFFGFAYTWGFFTFLVAAPIALWFILLADRYAHEQSLRRAAAITGVGLMLLASHGLMFLFGVGTGFVLLAAHARKWREFMKALWPYVIFGLASIAYFLISKKVSSGLNLQDTLPDAMVWGSGLLRIPEALLYALSADIQGISVLLPLATVLIMLAAPWLLGLRIDWQQRSSWLPLALVLAIMLLVPSYALSTQFLYQRFALFLLPAYAWMFTRQANQIPLARLVAPLLVVMCWAMLSLHSIHAWRFGQEASSFDRLMAAVEPGQRALALVLDRDSVADNNTKIYTHYPAWYQAEQQGFIDFNFAWFPPQIVRYRPEHLPKVLPNFEWSPDRFDWQQHGGDNYRYFFVRQLPDSSTDLFKSAPCPPKLVTSKDRWSVYEKTDCAGS